MAAVVRALIGFAACVATASLAAAQPLPPQRISPYVIDARGAIPFLGQNETTAASIGVGTSQLPRRGLGIAAGVHVYPFRREGWALGVGGEWMYARASQKIAAADGMSAGPTIDRRFNSLSGQVTINFGQRNGWSYLTGGLGPLIYDTWDDVNTPDGVGATTLNYGGGARWFTRPHVAFALDVRFYATRPAEPTSVVAARAKQTVMVISIGVSIR